MYKGNFRILIFIDLLATALGSSIILMMILSVNRGKAAGPAGKARDFIYYRVLIKSDTAAKFKLIVKNGETNEWIESDFPENVDAMPGVFLAPVMSSTKIFVWGPVRQFDSLGNYEGASYNMYCTTLKKTKWVVGVLYYNNTALSTFHTGDVSASIPITHLLRVAGKDQDSVVQSTVTLGNYSYITFKDAN
jgi:hypothetical protein